MNSATLDRLRDNIENMRCEATDKAVLTLANTLAQLIEEVQRIDVIACRASDTASSLANGIQPD